MRKLSILLVMCTISIALGAAAQGKKSKRSSSKVDIGDAIHKLKSPNPEEVLYSVQILAASGAQRAVGR